jgi:hypothetical protein
VTLPAQSALVLRRRSGWEACDSGVLLWRRNFPSLFLFSALPAAAIAFALRLFADTPFVSYLVLWWSKPLWDRLILHVAAVRFFRPECPARLLFAGLGRDILRGLPGDLLWRRFSPWRASRLPVRVLETLRGKAYRQRISFLREGGLGFCFFLTVFGFVLEYMVIGGEAGFVFTMRSLFSETSVSDVKDFFLVFEYWFFWIWCVTIVFLEGLFVCMGFGLYINSRVCVEGWDIQLLLQKAIRAMRGSGARRFP